MAVRWLSVGCSGVKKLFHGLEWVLLHELTDAALEMTEMQSHKSCWTMSAPVVATGLLRRLPQVLQHVAIVALELANARNACSALVAVPGSRHQI